MCHDVACITIAAVIQRNYKDLEIGRALHYCSVESGVGMGRYQYRYRKYRHIGTFFSIGIGKQKNVPILES